MLLRVSVLFGLLVLMGCEDLFILVKVCEEIFGFCSDLNKDSYCKE